MVCIYMYLHEILPACKQSRGEQAGELQQLLAVMNGSVVVAGQHWHGKMRCIRLHDA